MHYLVSNSNIEAIKTLIEKGANIEAKNINSYAPLHIAAIKGAVNFIEMLIEKKRI